MKKIVFGVLVIGLLALSFSTSVAGTERSSKTLIYFDFSGEGEGQTDVQAVENAIADAVAKAASAGYGNCQLRSYSYYPYAGQWLASAQMTCSKDTSPPPPPPPPGPLPPPEIYIIHSGSNHTVSWSSPDTTRFALEQKVNSGTWEEIYKGSATSRTIANPQIGTVFYYRVLGINGIGNIPYSSVVMFAPTDASAKIAPIIDYLLDE